MSKVTNYNYIHKNEPAVMIITANDPKEAYSILSCLVKLPNLWRLDEVTTVSDK